VRLNRVGIELCVANSNLSHRHRDDPSLAPPTRRDLAILAIHLIATIARLLLPGGARSIVSESLLLKQQLLILNRSRARAPNLRPIDPIIARLCAGLMRVLSNKFKRRRSEPNGLYLLGCLVPSSRCNFS
jgi:hypothetical protein